MRVGPNGLRPSWRPSCVLPVVDRSMACMTFRQLCYHTCPGDPTPAKCVLLERQAVACPPAARAGRLPLRRKASGCHHAGMVAECARGIRVSTCGSPLCCAAAR